jgi:uncharacterized membrane protein
MSADRGPDPPGNQRLERAIGFVLHAGVMASSACLAIGLALALVSGEGGMAGILLHAGIIVLLATPVARVVVSVGQYASQRDWTFTALTVIVLVELMASAAVALVFNKRL